MMDYGLLGYFGKDVMSSMEPERHVVSFKVAFDYNYHTFVPIEPPIISSVDDNNVVRASDAAQIHRLYDEAKQINAQPPSNLPAHMRDGTFAPVISYVEYIGVNKSDRQVLIHTNMIDLEDDDDDDVPESVSFDDLVHELQHNVTLASKKFAQWESLREANIQKQINAVQENEHFAPFVAHALHMQSSEEPSRNNSTHVVMVHVKQGFGLGEIVSLEKYSLVKMRDVKKEIKRRSKVKLDLGGGRANTGIVVFKSGESKWTSIRFCQWYIL
jgi:hypothetical protein